MLKMEKIAGFSQMENQVGKKCDFFPGGKSSGKKTRFFPR